MRSKSKSFKSLFAIKLMFKDLSCYVFPLETLIFLWKIKEVETRKLCNSNPGFTESFKFTDYDYDYHYDYMRK